MWTDTEVNHRLTSNFDCKDTFPNKEIVTVQTSNSAMQRHISLYVWSLSYLPLNLYQVNRPSTGTCYFKWLRFSVSYWLNLTPCMWPADMSVIRFDKGWGENSRKPRWINIAHLWANILCYHFDIFNKVIHSLNLVDEHSLQHVQPIVRQLSRMVKPLLLSAMTCDVISHAKRNAGKKYDRKRRLRTKLC